MRYINEATVRKMIGNDLFDRLDREIKNIGKIKVFYFFNVSSIEELFSAFMLISGFLLAFIFYGILSGIPVIRILLVVTGVVIMTYVTYRKPIDEYKERLMKDNELPAILSTIADGLSVGMPVENILEYISNNKKGYTADIIRNALNSINAGISMEESLKESAQKSMNKYFKRAVNILIKSGESVQGLSKQINDLYEEIEEEKINQKTEKAAILDNSLFFPIFLGYLIPLLIMIILPFIQNIGFIFNMGL